MAYQPAGAQPWYRNHDELCRFARWLVDNTTEVQRIEDLLYVFERPDKYTAEYRRFCADMDAERVTVLPPASRIPMGGEAA